MNSRRREFLLGSGTIAAGWVVPGRAWAAKPSFDISYLWSRNREAVLEYREVVGEVLGPRVAQNLQVVKGAAYYGLIYDRSGTDAKVAQQVARAHQRLLSRRFETNEPLAVVIADRGYRRIPDAATARKPAPAPKRPAAAETKGGFPDLPAANDTKLRHRVNDLIQQERGRGERVEEGERTAWFVYTLHDDRAWVAINADEPMQSASMVKPFVALAYAHEVNAGRLVWDSAATEWLRLMLVWSDNPSTNHLMERVGGPSKVQALLSRHYPSIFRATSIVESIPEDGRTYQNRASASDYVRFARALWHRQLPSSDVILTLMASSRRSRIEPAGEAVEVAHKTGTTARLCGDFGIVEAPGFPYVMVGIIEREARAERYAHWLTTRASVIRDVAALVHTDLATHYPGTRGPS